MPAVHLHGYFCTGHICYPPRPNAQASPDVFVGGLGWHAQGHLWHKHDCTCPPEPPYLCGHSSVLAKGSETVYVNNRQAGRIGDPVACESFAAMGFPTVFCGD